MPSPWVVLSVLREVSILMDLRILMDVRTGLVCFCPCVGACGSDSRQPGRGCSVQGEVSLST